MKVRVLATALMLPAAASSFGQIDLSAWPQVKLELSLTDPKGNPLAIPPPAAFLLKEDGRPQSVVSLDLQPQPQSVCILIDTSGSMYQRTPMAIAAASRFIQDLPAEDDLCVATFDWHLRIEQRLTSDRGRVLAALKEAQVAHGGTAMYDAIAELAKYMHDAAHSRSRAILIFTDGSDNASTDALKQLGAQLESEGNPVLHIIRLPAVSAKDSPSQDLHDRRTILSLASIGAGQPYFPRDEREIGADIDNLVQAMKARYMLTYVTVSPATDGRERHLEVALDKAHGGKKLVVHAPEGYYAPSK